VNLDVDVALLGRHELFIGQAVAAS